MSLRIGSHAVRVGSFPRVSGDELATHTAFEKSTQFSPRERG